MMIRALFRLNPLKFGHIGEKPLIFTPPRRAMAQRSADFGDEVARAALAMFKGFPSKGKPNMQPHEWTVLSAMIMTRDGLQVIGFAHRRLTHVQAEVVALGTGTRVLGEQSIAADGTLLHDSHAEVITVRSFRRCVHCETL